MRKNISFYKLPGALDILRKALPYHDTQRKLFLLLSYGPLNSDSKLSRMPKGCWSLSEKVSKGRSLLGSLVSVHKGMPPLWGLHGD